MADVRPRLPLVLRAVAEAAVRMPWQAGLLVMGAHFASSWAGYLLIGEELALSPVNMLYNYVVTGSSVGYGDLAPQTAAGRFFASLWVIPGAIASFAWLIGKAITTMTTHTRNIMNGAASYAHLTAHQVIIGYVRGDTERLITETENDHAVIISSERPEHSAASARTSWVSGPDLTDPDVLERAGVRNASSVIIMTADDDTTLAACLALCGAFPDKPAVALFRDERKARLVSGSCRRIEAVVSPAVSMLARAAEGPGTAQVIRNLLSVTQDDSIYHASWRGKPGKVSDVKAAVEAAGAVLLAVGHAGSGPEILPDLSAPVENGADIYFVGKRNYADFDEQGAR